VGQISVGANSVHVRGSDHEALSLDICDYWKKLTEGRGDCHSCNADWDETSEHYGLGLINRHDTHLRRNLREGVLGYLAKPDQRVLVRPYKGLKLTGCGFTHRAKPVAWARRRTKPRSEPKPPAC
jgi:hypothetical protein